MMVKIAIKSDKNAVACMNAKFYIKVNHIYSNNESLT